MKKFSLTHPFTIIFNLARVLYLIIIPLARGLVAAISGDFENWVQGAWLDILVLVLMVSIAVLRWLMLKVRITAEHIEIKKGVGIRSHTIVAWSKATTVSSTKSFYLRPFNAVYLRVDTPGKSFRGEEISIIISKKRLAKLGDRHHENQPSIGKVYQPTTFSIVALSLLTSNSFGGIVFLAALVSESGKIIGEEFQSTLIGTFEDITRKVAFGAPPAAAAIALLLLIGWLISFALSIIRYKNFTLVRKSSSLDISGGVLTKRNYSVKYADIVCIDIRQSLVTKLLKLHALYLSAVGYGRRKDDITCVVPTVTRPTLDKDIDLVFGDLKPQERQYKPEAKGIMSFVGAGIVPILLLLAAMTTLWFTQPDWREFIYFVTLMMSIPAAFYFVIQVFDYMFSGIAFDGENYTLRFAKRFTLHTVIIPKEKVVAAEIRQNLFQKSGPYCHVYIRPYSENRRYVRIKSLKTLDMMQIFNLNIGV